jgi:hypothetical protein
VALTLRVALGLACFDGSVASFAWALCAAACATLPVQCWLAARHLELPPRPLAMAVGSSALAAGAVVVVPLPLAPLAWLAVLACSRHPLVDEWLQLRLRITSRK